MENNLKTFLTKIEKDINKVNALFTIIGLKEKLEEQLRILSKPNNQFQIQYLDDFKAGATCRTFLERNPYGTGLAVKDTFIHIDFENQKIAFINKWFSYYEEDIADTLIPITEYFKYDIEIYNLMDKVPTKTCQSYFFDSSNFDKKNNHGLINEISDIFKGENVEQKVKNLKIV